MEDGARTRGRHTGRLKLLLFLGRKTARGLLFASFLRFTQSLFCIIFYAYYMFAITPTPTHTHLHAYVRNHCTASSPPLPVFAFIINDEEEDAVKRRRKRRKRGRRRILSAPTDLENRHASRRLARMRATESHVNIRSTSRHTSKHFICRSQISRGVCKSLLVYLFSLCLRNALGLNSPPPSLVNPSLSLCLLPHPPFLCSTLSLPFPFPSIYPTLLPSPFPVPPSP